MPHRTTSRLRSKSAWNSKPNHAFGNFGEAGLRQKQPLSARLPGLNDCDPRVGFPKPIRLDLAIKHVLDASFEELNARYRTWYDRVQLL